MTTVGMSKTIRWRLRDTSGRSSEMRRSRIVTVGKLNAISLSRH
jgi:hypothetical protein